MSSSSALVVVGMAGGEAARLLRAGGQVFEPAPMRGGRAGFVGQSRRSHTREQARVDMRWLAWVDRFKFVNARLAAQAMGVSERAARGRLKRMSEREGWLRCLVGQGIGRERLYAISPAGSAQLGHPPRKPFGSPPDYVHEMLVAMQVVHFDQSAPAGYQILSERQCRRAEARGEGKYSIQVTNSNDRRWPDIVAIHGGRLIAFEIELTQKSRRRYELLVDAYLNSQYAEVTYRTSLRAVERAITDLAEECLDTRLASVRSLERRQALSTQLCQFTVERFRLRLP